MTLNSEEGPGYGVALLAAVGAGEYASIQEACAATISVKQETAANADAVAVYNKSFPVYQKLYESLKDDFKAISALG